MLSGGAAAGEDADEGNQGAEAGEGEQSGPAALETEARVVLQLQLHPQTRAEHQQARALRILHKQGNQRIEVITKTRDTGLRFFFKCNLR